MSKPKTTKERGLLDKVLNDIFERELKAYAREPQVKPVPESKTEPELELKAEPELSLDIEPESRQDTKQAADKSIKIAVQMRPKREPLPKFVETPQDYQVEEMDRDCAEDAESEPEEAYEYSDWSYETPRPWLTIKEAASMLGRSPKAVERSIAGRWGNHLPEGWTARKVRIDGSTEWRVIPPVGFRIKHSRRSETQETIVQEEIPEQEILEQDIPEQEIVPTKSDLQSELENLKKEKEDLTRKSAQASKPANATSSVSSSNTSTPFSFGFDSLEKIVQSAAQMAQKELASFMAGPERTTSVNLPAVTRQSEPTTIVIDRSDEVEKLLRELADVQRELALERKAHLEDMRLINEMQSSMRLLEDNARETRELKDDLLMAQTALLAHKKQYQEFLELPWWKRLFHK